MPGATSLGDKLQHPPVPEHEVMRRDLAARIAQPRKRLRVVGHAGIVQKENVDWVRRALPVVGRGMASDTRRRHALTFCLSISSQAALIAASLSLAMRMNSSGTPRAIRRSGWFS